MFITCGTYGVELYMHQLQHVPLATFSKAHAFAVRIRRSSLLDFLTFAQL
jgi:hypothetical protein